MAKKGRGFSNLQSKPKDAGKAGGAAVKPKPKSRRARRIVEAREPKLVEDPKKALLLYGGRTSQVVKDVLSDFGKLKGLEAVKLTRKNAEVRPFEAGGEGQLEHLARRADAALFALGSSTKKRPHNLTLGRFFDGRLYDVLELGVDKYTSIRDFGRAAEVQIGNKPAIIFAGELFEKEEALAHAKGLLLDFFRGRQVNNIALKGVDRVMCVNAADVSTLLVRQYRIRLKKTGTKLPRVELVEMGPRLDLSVRRRRDAPPDLAKEAHRQPKLTGKKVKNVGSDELEGKVGRIYMPAQDVGSMALHKMKGLKRERREAAGDAKARKRGKAAQPAEDDAEEEADE